jgi:O-Antigen ligase
MTRSRHEPVTDVSGQFRAVTSFSRAQTVVMLSVTAVLGLWAYITAPAPTPIVATLLIACIVMAAASPRIAIYLILFFGLLGDQETLSWWPFASAFSQRESALFLHDSIPFTPLDLILGACLFSVLTRRLVDRDWRLRRGRLFAPMCAFGGVVLLAMVRGVAAGGDHRIALQQVRPLLYCVLLYMLTSFEFRTARHFRIGFAVVLASTTVQSIVTLNYYRLLPEEAKVGMESLGEHPAALIQNLVFVTFIGLLVFGATRWKRWLLFAMLPVVVYTYLLSQRRAAMVALIIAACLIAVMVYLRSRKQFWKYVPPIVVLVLGFVAATWNNRGTLGLVSSAVKSMFFPGSLDSNLQASELYRTIETFNLWSTLRPNFLVGLGFGRPFTVVWPMPDLSTVFEQWQYFPHNSVLGMYINVGIVGFAVVLYLFGRAIQMGVVSAVEHRPDDATIALAAVAFVLMFMVFAFVDIAWGVRPLLVLGLSFAICADFPDEEPPPQHPRAKQEKPERLSLPDIAA